MARSLAATSSIDACDLEYVATRLRPIRQLAQVELEQVAPIRRYERRGNFGMGERRLHLLGRAGTDDDRAAGLVRLAERARVRHVVEDERVTKVELALERDLRDP